jgi:carbon monoxide dehydrogenase subunit G
MTITPIGGLAAAALVAASLTSARPGDPDAAGDQTVVTVGESHGEYRVTARFRVTRPPEVVLAVLTDYDRIADFMPGVEKSVVVERGQRRALVEQQLTSRMMMFRKRVRLLLEIVETADAVRFHDRAGESFAVYEGMWRLSDAAKGTEISYELNARPAFGVPDFVLKRVLKRDSASMIEALQREIACRATN